MKSLFVFILAGSFFGCGDKLKLPKKEQESNDESSESPDGNAAPAPFRTESVKITADHTNQLLDVLVLVERSGSLSGQFGQRLALAAPTLAARMRYSGHDWQLGIGSSGIPNPPPEGEAPTEFAGDIDTPILTEGVPDVTDLIVERLSSEPDGRSYQPLTALLRTLERGAVPESSSAGFFRDGAYLKVVMIARSDERQEQLLPDDLMEALDEHRGPGNWSVSTIVTDW